MFYFICDRCLSARFLLGAPYTITGHFGHKTLRHQDTLGHFGTGLKTLRHECHDRGKAGTVRPRTIPMRHRLHSSNGDSSSAPILWCRSVLRPKCPAPPVRYSAVTYLSLYSILFSEHGHAAIITSRLDQRATDPTHTHHDCHDIIIIISWYSTPRRRRSSAFTATCRPPIRKQAAPATTPTGVGGRVFCSSIEMDSSGRDRATSIGDDRRVYKYSSRRQLTGGIRLVGLHMNSWYLTHRRCV